MWPKFIPLYVWQKRQHFWILETRFGNSWPFSWCSCLHMQLLTYIHCVPASVWAFRTQSMKRKETWWREGGGGKSRWGPPLPHVPALWDKDRLYWDRHSLGKSFPFVNVGVDLRTCARFMQWTGTDMCTWGHAYDQPLICNVCCVWVVLESLRVYQLWGITWPFPLWGPGENGIHANKWQIHF